MQDKYKEFWTWFEEHNEYIWNNIETNASEIGKQIDMEIKKIDDDIAFEIYFEIHNGKRDFIISADGIERIFPQVIGLCKTAPEMKLWNVIAFRPRTNQNDQCIEIDQLCLDYTKIFFKHNFNSIPFDIDVYIKNYDGKDNRYVHGYFLLLDTLIGEYEAVTSIKQTRIHPYKPEIRPQLTEFIKLRSIMDDLTIKN